MIDTKAATYGLPDCLLVPVAATSVEAVEKYVGAVVQTTTGRDGAVQSLLIETQRAALCTSMCAPLWRQPNARQSDDRLHPARQYWVHVDYRGYRAGYERAGMPPIPNGYFLDHVQNREAVRLRNRSHPFIRLCPISRSVNTSGGVDSGGEGMEKEYRRFLNGLPPNERAAALAAMPQSEIIYADPMDLTKMLNIEPGVGTLDGVRDTQALFYP